MTVERLTSAGLAPPPEPYVHAVRAGELVFIAGQVALDEDNRVVGPGDPSAQIEQCWRNISRALTAAGGTLRDVVKIVCYFKDIRHFPLELEVRQRLLGDGPYPVATVLQVANLGLDALLVEIDATAVVTSG